MRSSLQAVHPRGRGEHMFTELLTAYMRGSSPRARGTLSTRAMYSARCWFIPAGAGNTVFFHIQKRMPVVHPRGRGEHLILSMRPTFSGGSSPRARGTQVRRLRCRSKRRFIPAGAGNTVLEPRRVRVLAVHPRGRGEHKLWAAVSVFNVGSSPRARGTPR